MFDPLKVCEMKREVIQLHFPQSETCSICLNEMCGKKVKYLRCKHVFHISCINKSDSIFDILQDDLQDEDINFENINSIFDNMDASLLMLHEILMQYNENTEHENDEQ